METKNNILLIVLGLVCVGLLISNIVVYSNLNSKINSLNEEKTTLLTEKSNLQTQLGSSQELVTAKGKEFTDYKDLLKKYMSASKVVLEDTQTISQMITKVYGEQSSDYDTWKRHSTNYDAMLGILKDHMDAYETILTDNKEVFEEIGIDVEEEIEGINKIIPEFDEFSDTIQTVVDYLE